MAISEIETVQSMVSAGTYSDLEDLQSRVEAGTVTSREEIWDEIESIITEDVPMVLKKRMRVGLGLLLG